MSFLLCTYHPAHDILSCAASPNESLRSRIMFSVGSIRWWPWYRCSYLLCNYLGGWEREVRSGSGLDTQWVLTQCLLVKAYKAAG